MTGVQTCALPICFPVTILVDLNESHFLGHRIGYRCKCWFAIDRIVDDWDEVHWSCVPEEFRECIESEFFEIDMLKYCSERDLVILERYV